LKKTLNDQHRGHGSKRLEAVVEEEEEEEEEEGDEVV
jgi:hypothetical protein